MWSGRCSEKETTIALAGWGILLLVVGFTIYIVYIDVLRFIEEASAV